MNPKRHPRMQHALVTGKFYPPHCGHVHLIAMAATFSEHVTVAVLAASHESLSLSERVAWLREALSRFPGVRVAGVHDDLPVDYADAKVWEGHIAFMRQAVELADGAGARPPLDAVFSSEKYGYELGRRMHIRSVVLDPKRTSLPVSGTAVRSDVPGQWGNLPAATRAGLTVRVVVLGAESTGTTTLARDLARTLRSRSGAWGHCAWVPEYGRDYCTTLLAMEASNPGADMPQDLAWTETDFLTIAAEQTHMENEVARAGGPVLILDTDALATVVWHERYRHTDSNALNNLAASLPRRELYILTSPEGVAFEQDGLRDGEHLRDSMHLRFRQLLEQHATAPWIEVVGSPEERVQQSLARIEACCRARWTFTDPFPEANKP